MKIKMILMVNNIDSNDDKTSVVADMATLQAVVASWVRACR